MNRIPIKNNGMKTDAERSLIMIKHSATSGRLSESVRKAQGILTDFSVCESAAVTAYCAERGYLTESVADSCGIADEEVDLSLMSDQERREHERCKAIQAKWYKDTEPQRAARDKQTVATNVDKRQNLYRDLVRHNAERNRSRSQQTHYDNILHTDKRLSHGVRDAVARARGDERGKERDADYKRSRARLELRDVDRADRIANRDLAPHRKRTGHWEAVDEASVRPIFRYSPIGDLQDAATQDEYKNLVRANQNVSKSRASNDSSYGNVRKRKGRVGEYPEIEREYKKRTVDFIKQLSSDQDKTRYWKMRDKLHDMRRNKRGTEE
jgi:hypothetical protein